MDSKIFAIKIPENEKIAMDYISTVTNNTLSKLFYKPLQSAIYSKLGLILLYKIDLRNTAKMSQLSEKLFNLESMSGLSLPIIEDFIGLILDKNIKTSFWKIFGDIKLNEKDFLLHELDIIDLANYMGREYLLSNANLEEIDIDLARSIFFNYMLRTYFNTTALGSINKLNLEWNNHQPLIRQFQSQITAKYLNKFQPKKLEAIKVDEMFEVSEYIE
ncbi:hypothetical protein [[Eubacterium] cellulosolvens]